MKLILNLGKGGSLKMEMIWFLLLQVKPYIHRYRRPGTEVESISSCVVSMHTASVSDYELIVLLPQAENQSPMVEEICLWRIV